MHVSCSYEMRLTKTPLCGHSLPALFLSSVLNAHTPEPIPDRENTQGMEDARAALGRETAKVLRLEAELSEAQKKLAQAAEDHKELVLLRTKLKVKAVIREACALL